MSNRTVIEYKNDFKNACIEKMDKDEDKKMCELEVIVEVHESLFMVRRTMLNESYLNKIYLVEFVGKYRRCSLIEYWIYLSIHYYSTKENSEGSTTIF